LASADKDKLAADLSAYLDGELSHERARAVEQFLAESEEARQTLSELRAISEGLAGLPRMRAPEGLAEIVRPNTERRALSQTGLRTGQPRVLKLFARISASAALIAACVLAGWTVFEHVSTPTPTGAKSDAVARQALAETDAAGPDIVARGPAPESGAHIEGSELRGVETLGEAPAIAMAEKSETLGFKARTERALPPAAPADQPAFPRAEVLTTKDKIAAGDAEPARTEERFLASAAPAVMDTQPAVNVVIAPRNAEEYGAALRTVAAWQRTPVTAGRRAAVHFASEVAKTGKRAAPATAAETREYEVVAPRQQDFIVAVTPSDFNALLVSLDQQAPGQVQAAVNFNARDISQVQRLVIPTGLADTSDERMFAEQESTVSEPAAGAARAGGRGGESAAAGGIVAEPSGERGRPHGRVLRGTAQPIVETPAETEETRRGREAATPARPGDLDAQASRQLKALGYVDESRDAAKGEKQPPADEKKGLADVDEAQEASTEAPRDKEQFGALADRVEKLDTAAHGAVREGMPEAREPRPAPNVIRQLGNLASQLRTQLGRTYETMLGIALRAEVPQGPPLPEPAPVTLRVTLLPPPPAATQPGSPAPLPETP
jgi:hypothetical protein